VYVDGRSERHWLYQQKEGNAEFYVGWKDRFACGIVLCQVDAVKTMKTVRENLAPQTKAYLVEP
jgi:hypothetical protein